MQDNLIQALNAPNKKDRLAALQALSKDLQAPPRTGIDMNNHIHSTYSFSPYSPSMAVWKSFQAGLSTCGIIDHDSISGAEEFIEAGKIINFPVTIGFEMRVSFMDTPFADRRLNNPDQNGNVYCTVHAIPHSQIEKVKAFFAPINEARGKRNRKMVEKINTIFAQQNIRLDYDKDVLPLSMAHDGGSVTERHLMFALAHKLMAHYDKGEALIKGLEEEVHMNISAKIKDYLLDKNNPFYDYDLLGALKSEFIPKVYIPATDESPDYRTLVAFANEIGAISSYAYLGDIGDSVTGDKKSQKFEDDYLEELLHFCKDAGFNAVSYMPSRNTKEQLARVQRLCEELSFLQISGEDINQPRQKFICEAARDPSFAGLIDTTWALIGNEAVASNDLSKAFYSAESIEKYPDLNERIQVYKQFGLQK